VARGVYKLLFRSGDEIYHFLASPWFPKDVVDRVMEQVQKSTRGRRMSFVFGHLLNSLYRRSMFWQALGPSIRLGNNVDRIPPLYMAAEPLSKIDME